MNEELDQYFSHSREEMLEFIPTRIEACLEIGCGNGNFGTLVKEKTNCEYWGIEPNQNASKIAKMTLDHIIHSSFDNAKKHLDKKFDCIVLNDVLEHMPDPWQVLISCQSLLTKRGKVVCSIPNFLYIHNLKEILIDRDWKYKDSGTLDITHLRFFTKKSIIRLFQSTGYSIEKIKGINSTKSLKAILLNRLSFSFLEEMLFLQFAIVAKPNDGCIDQDQNLKF